MRELKIPNKVIENLVLKDNPFPNIFRYMKEEIWKPMENVSDYFQQERKAREFEKFLQDAYFEIFTEELPKHTSGGLDVDLNNERLVLLDMLSIREGILLKEHLEDEGYKLELDYSFSSLPSTTEAFKDKIDLNEKKEDFKFKKINNSENFSLDGDEDFIWSSFPDKWLESIQEGKKVLSSEEKVYRGTKKHLDKILDKLNADKIVVSSDHG